MLYVKIIIDLLYIEKIGFFPLQKMFVFYFILQDY